jgi:hypothetical protein
MNANVESFSSSKAFYREFRQTPGLGWLCRNYRDMEGSLIADPRVQRHEIVQDLRRFRFFLAILVIFSLTGYSMVVWKIMLLTLSKCQHDPGSSLIPEIVAVLSAVSLIVAVLFLREVRFGSPAIFDSWVKAHWTCHDFEQLVGNIRDGCRNTTACAGRNLGVAWMGGNGFETMHGQIPAHVVDACKEVLVMRAKEVKYAERADDQRWKINGLKNGVNSFLMDCKRLGIVPWDADPRPFYQVAEEMIKQEKPEPIRTNSPREV